MIEYSIGLSVFLGKLITITFILSLTFIAVKLVKHLINTLESKSRVLPGFDPAHYLFFKHFINGLIYFIGICLAISTIPSLKGAALSLFASSGILALIIGFASQQAFSNIVSGFFLGIFRPFVIGNRIHIKNISGIVDDITLRHTIIKTSENKYIMIPNAVMGSEIIENGSWASHVRPSLDIYISYESPIEHALTLTESILQHHPLCIDNRTELQRECEEPLVDVKVIKLAPEFIHIRAWAWTKSESDAFKLSCDSYKAIKEAFDTDGIRFPHCHCTKS
jgi:small conductance mechanosensitive channel